MGVVTDVVAFFAAADETFEGIKDQQLSDKYITGTLNVLMPLLYTLRWDAEKGTHNLVGLLLEEAPYVKKYEEKTSRLTKTPGIYSVTLD